MATQTSKPQPAGGPLPTPPLLLMALWTREQSPVSGPHIPQMKEWFQRDQGLFASWPVALRMPSSANVFLNSYCVLRPGLGGPGSHPGEGRISGFGKAGHIQRVLGRAVCSQNSRCVQDTYLLCLTGFSCLGGRPGRAGILRRRKWDLTGNMSKVPLPALLGLPPRHREV